MLGLAKAIPILTEGKRFSPADALKLGLVNELAADREQLYTKAADWIRAQPQARQPWDAKGFALPGGDMFAPHNAPTMALLPAMIFKKTRGLLPAALHILEAAAESAQVGFEAAMKIESREFCQLLMPPATEGLIRSTFVEMSEISAGASRPRDFEKHRIRRIGIIGAGMMGRGIAFSAAEAGLDVVLRDVALEVAEKGKAYSRSLLDKQIEQGRGDAASRDATLARIKPTNAMEDLRECDLVIEAVFEDLQLKRDLLAQATAIVRPGTLIATNTSTLPIGELARDLSAPADFIGLHFFSRVDKMHVVEIVRGRATSDETLARAFDFVQQIRKTPIVVNDHRGFFTSRVFIMAA